jgi:hypothetical protein
VPSRADIAEIRGQDPEAHSSGTSGDPVDLGLLGAHM